MKRTLSDLACLLSMCLKAFLYGPPKITQSDQPKGGPARTYLACGRILLNRSEVRTASYRNSERNTSSNTKHEDQGLLYLFHSLLHLISNFM